MTDLAKLVVRLEAQTAQYQAQLEKAQRRLVNFENIGSKAMGRLTGAIAAVSFGALVKGALDSADRMNDLSKQTGVAVESLSQLQYAAQQNDTDLEALNGGLRKLSKNAIDAADGTGASAEAFKALGVSVLDANGSLKTSEQLLLDSAEAFSKYEDGAEKSAAAQAIFGKTGTELIPFLNQGREGIQALRDEADRLGITLSQNAATAADDFNNAIARAKAQTTTFIAEALAPVIPDLIAAMDAFGGAAAGADKMSTATGVLQTGLKLLVDAGMSVAYTFRNVGKSLGNLAAASVAVSKLEFSRAKSIWADRTDEALREETQFKEALANLWDGALTDVTITAKKIGDMQRRLVMGGGLGGGKKKIDIAEVVAGGTKDPLGLNAPMEQYYANLQKLTQTSTENQLQQFAALESALFELRDAGRITAEQFNARYIEALDELISPVEVTAEKIGNKFKEQTYKMTEFAKEASRNVQDILGGFLENAMNGHFDNILKSFGSMLQGMVAQSLAADLSAKLFGKEGVGGGGGLLQKAGTFLSGLFGRAGGGGVSPGVPYKVNENTPNSEWFVPNTAGTIVPAGGMGGGMTVNNHFTIQATGGQVSRATQQQVAAAASRGLAAANRRNN